MKVNSHFLESGDRIYIGGVSIVFEELQEESEPAKSKTGKIPIIKKTRLGRIPTKRGPVDGSAVRRRLGALPPPGDEKLTLEDLRVVLSVARRAARPRRPPRREGGTRAVLRRAPRASRSTTR
jgi:hypothetical protein